MSQATLSQTKKHSYDAVSHHFFGISPYGLFCSKCEIPITTNRRCISNHLHGYCSHNLSSLHKFLAQEVVNLTIVCSEEPKELAKFMKLDTVHSRYFCPCGYNSNRKSNVERHTVTRLSQGTAYNIEDNFQRFASCSITGITRVDCYKSICGRYVPKEDFEHQNSSTILSDVSLDLASNASGSGLAHVPTTVTGSLLRSRTDSFSVNGSGTGSCTNVGMVSPCSKTASPAYKKAILKKNALDDTKAFLKLHMNNDENYEKYVSFFHPLSVLCIKENITLEDFIQHSLRLIEKPVTLSENALSRIVQTSSTWMKEHARLEVESIPAHLRSLLIMFHYDDVQDVSRNNTFTMWHNESKLLSHLQKLLHFFWRYNHLSFIDLKVGITKNSSSMLVFEPTLFLSNNFIPKILSTMVSERTMKISDMSLAKIFFLISCFHAKGEGLKMYSSETLSSLASAHLQLYRIGVCSTLYNLDDVDKDGCTICTDAKNSCTTNFLCSFIRCAKELTKKRHLLFLKQ